MNETGEVHDEAMVWVVDASAGTQLDIKVYAPTGLDATAQCK